MYERFENLNLPQKGTTNPFFLKKRRQSFGNSNSKHSKQKIKGEVPFFFALIPMYTSFHLILGSLGELIYQTTVIIIKGLLRPSKKLD